MVFSLLLFNLNSIPLVIGAQEEFATFSWAETTFSTSLAKVWNGDPVFQNYTGSYSDVYTFTDHYINHSDNTYIEEKRIVDYDANYSYYYNYSFEGSFDLDIDMTVYRVDVDYGSSAKLIWIALKKGFYEIEWYFESYGFNYEYNETNHQIIEKEIKKYDLDTLELLDTWNETDDVYDTMNYSSDQPIEIMNDHMIMNETFTKPLFLTFQIYETEKGDRIGWASIFSEFLVFKDKDGDGIYSVGDFETPPTTQLSIYSSSEYRGHFIPEVYEYGDFIESQIRNATNTGNFPFDKSVDEIASNIVFTPPTLVENDIVAWNINYRDFPIRAVIGGNEVPIEQRIRPGRDPLYSDLSPSDFSYGFDYKIGGGKADLSLTLGLPALTNLDAYNILEQQNYGLTLPRYDYFLSSFDINEREPKEITIPSNGFFFESNNETVAEINLINPIKKNYTLFDYPKAGETTSVESRGASINNIVMSSSGFQVGNPEINLLSAIEEIANSIPGFTIVDSLSHVHTENYPVWAGKRLVHDPTNTIYFENITLPFRVATDLISGFDIGIILGSLSLAVLVLTLKLKKFKKK